MAKFFKQFFKFMSTGEINRNISNKKKGDAFIDETRNAEKEMDNLEQNCNVEETKMRTKDSPEELKNKGKLFVGGLSCLTTSKGLQTYFSQFGKVLDAIVMRYPSGRSRKFGFILFAETSHAELAIRSEDHVLDGKRIDVRPFVSTEAALKKNNYDFKVFLGGLPEGMSTDVLQQFFERYGEISRIVIPVDKLTKKPKGYGFLWYTTEDAVKKCLAEEFVHLGGRRIHIKRAEDRSSSHVRGENAAAAAAAAAAVVAEKDPDQEDTDDSVFRDLWTWDRKSTSPVLGDNTTSASRGEGSGDLQYFLKSLTTSKLTDEKEMEIEEKKRLNEKLLTEFLVSSASSVGSEEGWDENLILFSDDSDSEESDNGTDNYLVAHGQDDTNALDELSKEFMDMLMENPPVRDIESLILLNDTDNDEDCRDFQTSVPFKFKDRRGLFCSLCEWTPQDSSFESFLTHCKTPAHMLRLKDRFPRELSQVNNDTDSGKREKTDPKWNSLFQKPPDAVLLGKSKSQNENQPQEKREKPYHAKQKHVKKNVQNEEKVDSESALNQSKPKQEKNKMVKMESLKHLKTMALAKGTSCILPVAGGRLMCTMCKKSIPQAEDFSVVMRNVSWHLQSKRHLKKLLETEDLLKNSLQKSREKTSDKCAENPPQKKQNKAAPQAQKQKVPKNMNKAPGKNSNSKSLFLCIPCNYFNKNMELFKVHLKSEAHLDCFISRGVKTDLSLDNMTKCQNCEVFLFGSLYYINKHYSKCLEKK